MSEWTSLEEVPEDIKQFMFIPLTLEQANHFYRISYGIGKSVMDPKNMAWKVWQTIYKPADDSNSWVNIGVAPDVIEAIDHFSEDKTYNMSLSAHIHTEILEESGARVAIVNGLALAEGVWKGIFYSEEEIVKSLPLLLSQRVHYEHRNHASQEVMGFVIEVSHNTVDKGIDAKSMVFDADFVEFIAENGIVDSDANLGVGYSVQVMFKLRPDPMDPKAPPHAYDLSYGELTITGTPACIKCRISNGTVTELSEQKELHMGTTTEPEASQADPAGDSAVDVHNEIQNSLMRALTLTQDARIMAATLAIGEAMKAVQTDAERRSSGEDTPVPPDASEQKKEKEEKDMSTETPEPVAEPVVEDVVPVESADDKSVILSEPDTVDKTADLSQEPSGTSVEDIVSRVTAELSTKYEARLSNLEKENSELKAEGRRAEATERVEELMRVGAVIPANKNEMIETLTSSDPKIADGIYNMLYKQQGSAMLFDEEAYEVDLSDDSENAGTDVFDDDLANKDTIMT